MSNKKATATTTTKPKSSRSFSVNDIYNWKFEEQEMPQIWIDHIGNIDDRFVMYVDGEPGNGKTEYEMQLAKMLCNHIGKTRYNNVEQGKHSQIKQSAQRNKFHEIAPGKFQYDNIRNYEAFKAKLKKANSGKNIIIDSISYWPLNAEQIQDLIETFKNKNFVFVAYKAHFVRNQGIIHLCDTKVRIENFEATVTGSRFGGGSSYNIWPDRPQSSKLKAAQPLQPSLFGANGLEANNG